MSFFQGATHVAITGGTQIAAAAGSNVTMINQDGQTGAGVNNALKDLSAAAAHGALHNSSARFDAPRCHRNTRSSYLDALERWMLGRGGEYASARLIWLTGGAGAGKSAIMQSIVERCAQETVVLGTFFFSRTDPSRNYAEVLIPTLAYQLACYFPAAMAVLEPIIQRNPLIFKASLETQAHELLVRPLLHLIEHGSIDSTSPLRRVFVIDGLDECNNPQKQALIIHIIGSILCENVAPICFLIASRPEMAISRAFQREKKFHFILKLITLDNNAESSSDIRQFIEDSFLDILDTHPLQTHIPSNWPEPYSVDRLVKKSSGHFIYAATAMKFISSTDEHPARALRVVEGLAPSRIGNPFAELDALYFHILTSAKYSSQVLAILRHRILTDLDNSLRAVCFMYPNMTPEDAALFLSDVHALVSLAPDDSGEMWITLKHASLGDFLKDANRSHAIYMPQGEYRASLLPRYFHFFDTCSHITIPCFFSGEYRPISSLKYEIAVAIGYPQDIELLRSLIHGYPIQNVWNFFKGCGFQSVCGPPGAPVEGVSWYLAIIRDSAANYDNTLYIRQFKILMDVLMDDLDDLVQSEPRYRIIPALIFSSSPHCLVVAPFLIALLPQLNIPHDYCHIFEYLLVAGDGRVIDPRSYQAIRALPQAQLSWGSDLATLLNVVLRRLLGYSWIPECLFPNPHQQWLRRTKPLKYKSLGSPKLSSAFYSYIRRLSTPQKHWENVTVVFQHHRYSSARRFKISGRRRQCFTVLTAVICYLHKCDCTSELAKLARRSLPKAALWFPKLMKKARVRMDAYVLRWEESPDGLLERAQSLSINDMD